MSVSQPRDIAARGMVNDYALLLLMSAFSGATFGLIKIAVETIPPATLVAWRTALACAMLLAFMAYHHISLPRTREEWGALAVQACFNSVIPYTLIAWAQQTIDTSVVTILSSTTPVFAFLIGAFVTRREVSSAKRIAGVVLGLVGVVLIVGQNASGAWLDGLPQQVAVVGAAVCFAFSATLGWRFRHLDPTAPAAGSLLCGAIVLIPLSFILDDGWQATPSVRSLVGLAALVIFPTTIGFVLYFRLLRSLGSVVTTAQSYLRVPIGVAIGVICFGEALTAMQFVGLALVLTGVAAMAVTHRAADTDRS
ncbi:DMT family transporter [Mesorhizobium amorphae]|uniref:DMT family transporter n=1 Tax=Mesorhizobium amorphae TaxID=71433 RepID=UPI0021B31DD9|nr:DMT family transporter [Mesorhizobium amorphae]